MDVGDWLRNLGLGQYAAAFRDNEIDASVLPGLTTEDLKDLGVTLVGHRRRLLDAIAALGQEAVCAPSAAPVPAAAAEAERRQLTVLFCDLAGSTELAARLDPEDLRAIIAAYHQAVAAVLTGFGGFVAKYMGDGILAYFGYPEAHEEDAERATRASLAIVERVAQLDLAEKLAVRIGVATGLVVVGDLIGAGAAQEQAVVGETPNLAARLQGLAEPNAIVIADATRRQIGGLFEIRDLGAQSLKGFAVEQRVWRVVGESGVASRFEALRSGETPLVGRDEEIELLLRRWAQAKAGEGRVVLISAEPGIGKSRLAEAVEERIAAEPHARPRYFCSPHHQDSALFPVIGQIERAAGFARDDSVPIKHQKLAVLFAESPPDQLSLVAELLSLPATQARSDLELTPQRRKEMTFEALFAILERLSGHQPVLMLFEDVHWIDPTSRELLDRTIARIEHLPVLLIATFRPEFVPPWTGLPHVTMLALNRLGRRDGALLVERLVGNTGLPADLIAEIVERSDGVPLFLEEVTKVVIETGARSDAAARGTLAMIPGARLSVPPTLQASLMARLDRLGPGPKEIAQIGAAIGREFSYELLAVITPRGEVETQAALARLVGAGLVFQRGTPPTAEYQFKHALVQDTAYGTLLRGPRRQLHARIAAALEVRFSDPVAREPEALARHFSEAQQPDRALSYWLAAGERAIRSSANQEAIGHLTAGLSQLARLPDSADRTKQELALQRLLGQANFQVRGLGALETDRAFSRARDLCAAIDDDQSIIPVLFGIIIVEWGAGQLSKAEITANEILQRARRTGDTGAGIAADFAVAATSVQSGDLLRGRRHFDSAIASYRCVAAAAAHRFAYEYSIELGSFSYVYAGWCWWLLGYPEEALGFSEESIAVGERIRHDYSRSRVLYCKSVVHAFRREWALVEECATVSIAVGQERGLGMMVAVARIMLAAAQAMQRPSAEAVAEIQEAIRTYRATGTKLQSTHHLTLLAQAQAACGQYSEGLDTLREAAALVEDTGERYVGADIHRLKGTLLLSRNGSVESGTCYVRALKVARAQEARSLELRAATSLARLWHQQGRHDEARDLLAPIYDWFTEGFGTPDLIEAKALLAELG
jgi:class 3 adenylate cyclase/predicted ATPase